MSSRVFSLILRTVQREGYLNKFRIRRSEQLKINAGSIGFTRRAFCTELNSSSDVEPVAPNPPSLYEDIPNNEMVCHKKKRAGNFYDYADREPILQDLINLGVEIHKFAENEELCDYVMKLNFERDVCPYLKFLSEAGVPEECFGMILTKNPFILQCHMDDLNIRINYLKYRKFTNDQISHIITKNPFWLSFQVKLLDKKLGNIQQTFELTGDEIRSIVLNFPKIILIKDQRLKINMFSFKTELGFTLADCQSIILRVPKLLKMDNYGVLDTYSYLLDHMNVQLHLIVQQPVILLCRKHILAMRHKFLRKLGRDQFNPKLPGYVSLDKFSCMNDEEFCTKVAMTNVQNFYDFQKCL